jgi:hypothetical protein
MTNVRTGQTQQTSTQGTGQQDDTTTDDATSDTDTGRTRQDAGRLGGQVTKERHGQEHFKSIGERGGSMKRAA